MDLADVLESEGDPGSRATAASGDSPLASWTRSPPSSCPPSATASATSTASSRSGSRAASRSSSRTIGSTRATPGRFPRHHHAQVVRLYGTVAMRTRRRGRLVVDWVGRSRRARPALRLVHRRPRDRHREHAPALVGPRVAGVRSQALQRGRLLARAVEEKVEIENISKVLYPERPHRRRQGAAAEAAVLLRGVLHRGHRRAVSSGSHDDFRLLPERAAIQLNDTHPADRGRRADARARRSGGTRLGRRRGTSPSARSAYTNHTLLPEALEKWPVPMLRADPPAPPDDHLRDQPALPAPGDARAGPGMSGALERMSLIEEGPTEASPHGEPRRRRLAQRQRRGALHTELVKRELCRTSTRCSPSASTTRPTACRRAAGSSTRTRRSRGC